MNCIKYKFGWSGFSRGIAAFAFSKRSIFATLMLVFGMCMHAQADTPIAVWRFNDLPDPNAYSSASTACHTAFGNTYTASNAANPNCSVDYAGAAFKDDGTFNTLGRSAPWCLFKASAINIQTCGGAAIGTRVFAAPYLAWYCPNGTVQGTGENANICVKPKTCDCETKVGDPIDALVGNNTQTERDYAGAGAFPIVLTDRKSVV